MKFFRAKAQPKYIGWLGATLALVLLTAAHCSIEVIMNNYSNIVNVVTPDYHIAGAKGPFSIKNGISRSNTGHRLLVFERGYLGLRPVTHAVYSGYQPDRGTFQQAYEGDIVAIVSWDKSGEQYHISRVDSTGSPWNIEVPLGEAAEYWTAIRHMHPWADEWLEPSGRSGVWIPDDIITESEYISTIKKKTKLEKCFSRFGLPFKVENFLQDPGKGLKTFPRSLDVDLDTIQTQYKTWDGSVVSINESEQWFGSNGNGKPAVKLEHDPEFEHGSNYAHTETTRGEGTPGIKGWKKWKFVVRICFGAYTTDHSSWGHTIDVWQTR